MIKHHYLPVSVVHFFLKSPLRGRKRSALRALPRAAEDKLGPSPGGQEGSLACQIFLWKKGGEGLATTSPRTAMHGVPASWLPG